MKSQLGQKCVVSSVFSFKQPSQYHHEMWTRVKLAGFQEPLSLTSRTFQSTRFSRTFCGLEKWGKHFQDERGTLHVRCIWDH